MTIVLILNPPFKIETHYSFCFPKQEDQHKCRLCFFPQLANTCLFPNCLSPNKQIGFLISITPLNLAHFPQSESFFLQKNPLRNSQ